MKKLILILSIMGLVAAGCNTSQEASQQPLNPINSNSATTSTPPVVTTDSKTKASEDYCSSRPSGNQGEDQGGCYEFLAQQKNNPEICKLASSQASMDYCYFQLATVTKNLQLCSLIQSQDYKDHCNVFFGVANKDSGLCNMVNDQTLRQQCLSLIIKPATSTQSTTATSTAPAFTPATKLNINLDNEPFSGNVGGSAKVTGQIQNPTISALYLSGISCSFVSAANDPSNTGAGLSFDPTDFFSLVPPNFQPGQSYQGAIAAFSIDSSVKPGNYFFSCAMQGGKTEKDNGQLWSDQVSIQVK